MTCAFDPEYVLKEVGERRRNRTVGVLNMEGLLSLAFFFVFAFFSLLFCFLFLST